VAKQFPNVYDYDPTRKASIYIACGQVIKVLRPVPRAIPTAFYLTRDHLYQGEVRPNDPMVSYTGRDNTQYLSKIIRGN